MVKVISKVGGDYATRVGSLYTPFVEMGCPVKAQVENGLIKILDFQGHTIDVSDQVVFCLKLFGPL